MQAKALHQMMVVQKKELEEKAKANLEKDRIIKELRKELDAKKGTYWIFRLAFSINIYSSDDPHNLFL